MNSLVTVPMLTRKGTVLLRKAVTTSFIFQKEAPKSSISGHQGSFTIKWFDLRNGGDLQDGSIASIEAGKKQAISMPPSATDKDWAVYIKLN